MSVYSIEALKSFYKTHFKSRDIDNTPTITELISEPETKEKELIKTEKIEDTETIEEKMIKFYKEKEERASKIYQETLYLKKNEDKNQSS
jgi:hypothetical protein